MLIKDITPEELRTYIQGHHEKSYAGAGGCDRKMRLEVVSK